MHQTLMSRVSRRHAGLAWMLNYSGWAITGCMFEKCGQCEIGTSLVFTVWKL
jgi:hypothetical protein